MKEKGIYLQLVIDDKGTATIKGFDKAFGDTMNRLKSSTTGASTICDRAFGKMKTGLAAVRQHWLALTAAVAGFVLMTKRMINAFMEQERAELQLANAMKLAGDYTKEAHADMVKYAGALQMVTRYGDETILSAMNLLSTYRLQGDTLKWATARALDFTSAMGTMGMDISTAARYMGMAMQGNIEVLGRYIPQLRQSTNEKLKDMSATEKVTYFMKLMNEQFGGRAQMEMESYGAQLARIKNFLGDVQETIIKGLIAAFLGLQVETKNADEAFRRFALNMVDASYAITLAIKTIIDVFRLFVQMLDVGYLSLLKFQEGVYRLSVAVNKALVAFAKLTMNEEEQKNALIGLAGAQQSLIDTLEEQIKVKDRIAERDETIEKGNEALNNTFAELRASIETMGMVGANEITNVKIALDEAAKSAEGFSDKMQKGIDDAIEKIRQFVEEKRRLEESLTDRIYELTHNETQYKIYQLDKQVEELRKHKIDEMSIQEWYNLEVQKIYEDTAEKIKESTSSIWDDIGDIFKTTFTDAAQDMDNIWENLLNRMKYKAMDILGTAMIDLFKGLGTGGGRPAGVEGPLLESGKFFSQSSNIFSGAVELFKGAVSKFTGGFGPAGLGSAGLALILGRAITSAFAPSYMQGRAGFKGYAEGMKEGMEFFMKKAGPFGVLPGATMATLGFLGFHPLKGPEQKHMEAVIKRVQEFYDEYAEIMKKNYSTLGDMVDDFNALISHRHIEALEELGHITALQASYMHSFANYGQQMRREAELTGKVSVASFRATQDALTALTKTVTDPEGLKRIIDMQEKMRGLFVQDIMADFVDGLLSTEDAIKRLMRAGMSQLEAQTTLLGEDYNELMLIINGGIPVIDSSTEAFNDMRESLDRIDKSIEKLPDSLGEVKAVLQALSYTIRQLVNIAQTFKNLAEDLQGLPDIMTDIGEAIETQDFRRLNKELYKLENLLLDVSSAFGQLSEAMAAVGMADIAKAMAGIAKVAGIIAAFVMLATLITTIINAFKEMDELLKDMDTVMGGLIGKKKYWQEQIEKAMETLEGQKQIISDITAKLSGWKDLLDRERFGDVSTFFLDIYEQALYTKMQLDALFEAGIIDETQYKNALAIANEALILQLEKYFDALIEKFQNFSKQIAASLRGMRGEEWNWGDFMGDIFGQWMKMGETIGTGGTIKDYEKFLQLAGENYDLIMERYNYEKQRLQEIEAYLKQLESLEKGILRDITEVKGRTSKDIIGELKDVYTGMVTAWFEQDWETWISKAQEARGLILERYNLEKQKLEEIKGAYQSLANTITQQILNLKTKGMSQRDIYERMAVQYEEVERLRGLAAGATGAERAGYLGQLARALGDYLSMAEEAYTRPSIAYQSIFEAVVSELEGIRDEANTEVSVAEGMLIDLQNETIAQLEQINEWAGYVSGILETERDTIQGRIDTLIGMMEGLKGVIDNAASDLNTLKEVYIKSIEGLLAGAIGKDVGATATNTGNIAGYAWWSAVESTNIKNILSRHMNYFFSMVSYLSTIASNTKIKTISTHQEGLARVPYTGYIASLHKDETILPAGTPAVSVSLGGITINAAGGNIDGKRIAKELKHEIEWGELGKVIQNKVRKVA